MKRYTITKQISASLIIALALSLNFSACSKSDPTPPEEDKTPEPIEKTVVYVSGYEVVEDANGGENQIATYWNGKEKHLLEDGVKATSVLVVGTDLYVTGNVRYKTRESKPAYWINGNPKVLEPNSSQKSSTNYKKDENIAYAIAVVGHDVHVVGNVVRSDIGITGVVPMYWKNDDVMIVHKTNEYSTGIAVFNNDVYISGNRYYYDIYYGANYRKNPLGHGKGPYELFFLTDLGTEGAVTDPASPNVASAEAIAISAIGDIYIAGFQNNAAGKRVAKYWVNEIPKTLTNGTYDAEAIAIATVGTDVYVAGYAKNKNGVAVATYWKNHSMVELTNGSYDAEITGIVVEGDDVYASGTEMNADGIRVAKYWKNKTEVVLGDGVMDSYATGIAISKE